MRPAMLTQSSFSELEYAARGYVTRRDRLFRDLDAVIPWAALLATIEPVYPKGEGLARRPIALEILLRVYIAQQRPSLPGKGIEDATHARYPVRRWRLNR